MENTTENNVRRTIRIHVEPIDVELDEEGAILITTLQSALPGAFGLYFYDNDCRSSLRFDGKKLRPPGDGWKDRKYYALLGCRPFDYPFGSYTNATKQFERSVNTVQRLLANHKLFDVGFAERDNVTNERRKADQCGAAVGCAMQRLLTVTSKHGVSERIGITDNEQTPLEEQFVELARISTAKDSIIAQQRSDIKVANEKLEQKERSVKRLHNDLSKLIDSYRVKEEELALLRCLSEDQKFMCKKVNQLKSKLMDRENIIVAQRKEIEFLVRKMAAPNIEQLPSKEMSNLGKTWESADKVTVKASESGGEDVDQNDGETKHLTTDELASALARTKARNEQLEKEVNVAGEKYQQLNEVYTAVVAENTKLMAELAQLERETPTNILIKNDSHSTEDVESDESKWNSKHLVALKQDLDVSEKRTARLTRTIRALTESSDSELRAADTTATRSAMKYLLDQTDAKIQITISK